MFLSRYFDIHYGRDEALLFFAVFGRFEFALKRAGYLTDVAEPNWNKFANDIGEGFFTAVKSNKATTILFAEPARKMISDEGIVGWKDMDPPNNAVDLLVEVRRIRNNLFHGEKATMSSRDVDLIVAASYALDEAYYSAEGKTGIAKYFEEYVPGGGQ